MSRIGAGAGAIWVSEHYWPGVSDEPVFAQSQRLAEVSFTPLRTLESP